MLPEEQNENVISDELQGALESIIQNLENNDSRGPRPFHAWILSCLWSNPITLSPEKFFLTPCKPLTVFFPHTKEHRVLL